MFQISKKERKRSLKELTSENREFRESQRYNESTSEPFLEFKRDWLLQRDSEEPERDEDDYLFLILEKKFKSQKHVTRTTTGKIGTFREKVKAHKNQLEKWEKKRTQ